MIKIEHKSKMQGAEKFGSCASCGKERDVYKITFEEGYNRTSISLCFNCMNELKTQIINEKPTTMEVIEKSLCKYSIDGRCTNENVSADNCKATELQVEACLPYQRVVILTGESWHTET